MLLPSYRKKLHVSPFSQGIFLHLEVNEWATKQIEQRKGESVSSEESRALKLILETYASYLTQ